MKPSYMKTLATITTVGCAWAFLGEVYLIVNGEGVNYATLFFLPYYASAFLLGYKHLKNKLSFMKELGIITVIGSAWLFLDMGIYIFIAGYDIMVLILMAIHASAFLFGLKYLLMKSG